MKIDIEKLRAALIDAGVEPEKIEAVIAALSDDKADKSQAEGKGEEPSTADEAPVEEEAPSAEEIPVEEEAGEPVIEGEVPPVDESVPLPPQAEEVPPEVVAQEEGGPVPPVPPELPPVVSLEEFNNVKNELEETKKALEGLQSLVESLKEALQGAGVIDGSVSTPVGSDQPSVPGNKPVGSVMDDVLAEINRKNY